MSEIHINAELKQIKVISDEHSALGGWFTSAMAAFALRDTEISVSHATSKHYTLSHGSLTLQADVLLALQDLGITEKVLIEQANATPFLANQYIGWSNKGQSKLAGLAKSGVPLNGVGFVHYLTRLRNEMHDGQWNLEAFSLNTMCAANNTFTRPSADPRSILSSLEYGLRVNAKSLCALLKQVAVTHGNVLELDSSNPESNDKASLSMVTLDSRLCASVNSSDSLPIDTIKIIKYTPKEASLSNVLECLDNGYIERQYLQNKCYSRRFSSESFDGSDVPIESESSNSSRQFSMAKLASDTWQPDGSTIYLFETGVHQLLDDGGLGYRTQQLASLWPLLSGARLSETAVKYFCRMSAQRYKYWRDMAVLPMYLCNKDNTEFWQLATSQLVNEDLSYLVNFYVDTGVLPQFEHYPADSGLLENTLLAFERYPQNADPLSYIWDISELVSRLDKLRQLIKQTAVQLPQI